MIALTELAAAAYLERELRYDYGVLPRVQTRGGKAGQWR